MSAFSPTEWFGLPSKKIDECLWDLWCFSLHIKYRLSNMHWEPLWKCNLARKLQISRGSQPAGSHSLFGKRTHWFASTFVHVEHIAKFCSETGWIGLYFKNIVKSWWLIFYTPTKRLSYICSHRTPSKCKCLTWNVTNNIPSIRIDGPWQDQNSWGRKSAIYVKIHVKWHKTWRLQYNTKVTRVWGGHKHLFQLCMDGVALLSHKNW